VVVVSTGWGGLGLDGGRPKVAMRGGRLDARGHVEEKNREGRK
jgi:hypothetical protein